MHCPSETPRQWGAVQQYLCQVAVAAYNLLEASAQQSGQQGCIYMF